MELTPIYALSVYKQPFCHHKNKNNPKLFADKKYDNLDKILNSVRNSLKSDIIFAKVLTSFLMFPAYFSISDYSTIAFIFKKLDKSIINKVANTKSLPLIIYAYITSKVSSLGLHNFINLFLLLPEISKKNIYDFMIEDIYYPEIIYGFNYTFGNWIQNIVKNDNIYSNSSNDSDDSDSEIIIHI
jgi:hypothetical protein